MARAYILCTSVYMERQHSQQHQSQDITLFWLGNGNLRSSFFILLALLMSLQSMHAPLFFLTASSGMSGEAEGRG